MKLVSLILIFVSSLARAASYSGGLPMPNNNPSVGFNNAVAPTSSTEMGYVDQFGILRPITGSASGIAVTGTVTAFQGTSPWVTSRDWLLAGDRDSVGVTGTVTAFQGTNPWNTSRSWLLAGDRDSVGVTGTVTATQAGKTGQGQLRIDYAITAVASGSPTNIVSGFGPCNEVDIFDSSGYALTMTVNGGRVLNVYPGGNGKVPLTIPSNSTIGLQFIGGTAGTAGEFVFNCFN
jgi:hypothetical protein